MKQGCIHGSVIQLSEVALMSRQEVSPLYGMMLQL